MPGKFPACTGTNTGRTPVLRDCRKTTDLAVLLRGGVSPPQGLADHYPLDECRLGLVLEVGLSDFKPRARLFGLGASRVGWIGAAATSAWRGDLPAWEGASWCIGRGGARCSGACGGVTKQQPTSEIRSYIVGARGSNYPLTGYAGEDPDRKRAGGRGVRAGRLPCQAYAPYLARARPRKSSGATPASMRTLKLTPSTVQPSCCSR